MANPAIIGSLASVRDLVIQRRDYLTTSIAEVEEELSGMDERKEELLAAITALSEELRIMRDFLKTGFDMLAPDLELWCSDPKCRLVLMHKPHPEPFPFDFSERPVAMRG